MRYIAKLLININVFPTASTAITSDAGLSEIYIQFASVFQLTSAFEKLLFLLLLLLLLLFISLINIQVQIRHM